jgi:putative DNA methylase
MTFRKKLIEVALPLVAISEGGAREQSIKRGKPTQLHKWFAARPMVTCRAVLWASLIDDPSSHPEKFPTEESQQRERDRLFEILASIANWDLSKDPAVMGRAQAELKTQFDGDLPTIVDPFGGGGTIPLEALRLGLNGVSNDLNPVAVTLQRGLLDHPFRFFDQPAVHPKNLVAIQQNALDGFAADVEAYGHDVLRAVKDSHSSFYPNVDSPDGRELSVVAWIWARTVPSPDPSFRGDVPLVNSWLLTNHEKHGTAWVEPVINRAEGFITYRIRNGGSPPEGSMKGAGKAICIASGSAISADYIKSCAASGTLRETLIAVIGDGNPGRVVCASTSEHQELANLVHEAQWRPSCFMSSHPQYMGPPRYGMTDWWMLFTRRQLSTNVALATTTRAMVSAIESDAIRAGLADDKISLVSGGSGALAYAEAIVHTLAMVVDRVCMWNNKSCPWDNKNLVNQNVFRLQAVPMLWDFCEVNPLTEGAGSYPNSLMTISESIRALPRLNVGSCSVHQQDAKHLVEHMTNIVISTDPPYYDAVPYADISDFFYPWLRFMLSGIFPDDFATLASPKQEELVADSQRWGGKEGAKEHFETGMREFMTAAISAQRTDIPMTIFYAYKATEVSKGEAAASGWDTFLQSIVDSDMTVTATWPVRTENKSRLRAQNSNVLATSVVLACRRRLPEAGVTTRSDFISELRRELPKAVNIFIAAGVPGVDLAQAVIGPGIGVFSKYRKVFEASGEPMTVRTALRIVNDVLAEIQSGEDSEFDSFTLFAIALFQQFKFSDVLFGVADNLGNAKNVSPAAVVNAGIAQMAGGKFRLLQRSELDADWNPTDDSTLTVWEITQHLILTLEDSEVSASRLLSRVGGFGHQARQLAYLLYNICTKRQWADEAAKYNMLIAAWPEIQRLAAQEQPGGNDGNLFS